MTPKRSASLYEEEGTWAYMKREWCELFRPAISTLLVGSIAWYTGASTGQPLGYIAGGFAAIMAIAYLNQAYGNWFWWTTMPPGWYRRVFCARSSASRWATFPGTVCEDTRSSRVLFVVPAPGTSRDQTRLPELAAAADWMLRNMPAASLRNADADQLMRSFHWQHKYNEFIIVGRRRRRTQRPSGARKPKPGPQPTGGLLGGMRPSD